MFAKKTTTIATLVTLMALAPPAEATTRAITDNLLNATEPNYCTGTPPGSGDAWSNVPAGACITGLSDTVSSCTSGSATTCLDAAYVNYYGVLVMSDPNDELGSARVIYPGLATWVGAYGNWRDCNGDGFVDDRSIINAGLNSPSCSGTVDEFVPIPFHGSSDWSAYAYAGGVYFQIVAAPFAAGVVTCPPETPVTCTPQTLADATVASVLDLFDPDGTTAPLGLNGAVPIFDRPITCGAGDYADRGEYGDNSDWHACLVANSAALPNYLVNTVPLGTLGGIYVPDDDNVNPTETVMCVLTYSPAPPTGSGCERLQDQFNNHIGYVNTNLPDYLDTPGRPIARPTIVTGTPPDSYFDYCPTGPLQVCGYSGVDSISLHDVIAFPTGSFPGGVTVATWYDSTTATIDDAGRMIDGPSNTGYMSAYYRDVDYYNGL